VNPNSNDQTQILRLWHGRRGLDFRASRNDDLCQRLLSACQCRCAFARQRAQGKSLKPLLSGPKTDSTLPHRTSWPSDSCTESTDGSRLATSTHSAPKPEFTSQYWLWLSPWLCTARGSVTRLRSGGLSCERKEDGSIHVYTALIHILPNRHFINSQFHLPSLKSNPIIP
jgi:hypothetical protein